MQTFRACRGTKVDLGLRGQTCPHQREGHGAGALQGRRQHNGALVPPKPALRAAAPVFNPLFMGTAPSHPSRWCL